MMLGNTSKAPALRCFAVLVAVGALTGRAAAQDAPAAPPAVHQSEAPPAGKATVKPAASLGAVPTTQPAGKAVHPGTKAVTQGLVQPAGKGGVKGPPTPKPTVELKPGEVPKIAFDNPTYNFGRVPAGGEVVHDFWFTNTGTGPLEIVQAKPS